MRGFDSWATFQRRCTFLFFVAVALTLALFIVRLGRTTPDLARSAVCYGGGLSS